ncbi:MAG TPA: hypothetical protein VGG29_08030 [Caulobacteraceae bacterium]|jgi:hypothetical protein
MAGGGGASLCGLALLALHLARHSGEREWRIWNLMRWLGLGLPVPTNPWLFTPTLAFLNCPLWLMLSVLGVMIAAACWLVRAIG